METYQSHYLVLRVQVPFLLLKVFFVDTCSFCLPLISKEESEVSLKG